MDWAYAWLENDRNCSRIIASVDVFVKPVALSVWCPPQLNHFQLDVDVGFDSSTNRFGVGMVIRDFQGRVMSAHARLIDDPCSVKGAELVAIRCGLDMCSSINLFNVEVFFYSLVAIRSILNPLQYFSYTEVLAMEISCKLESSIFLSINHMHSLADSVPYLLAYKVLYSNDVYVWPDGVYPSWFSDVVPMDNPN